MARRFSILSLALLVAGVVMGQRGEKRADLEVRATAASTAPAWLVDVAATAGIRFKHAFGGVSKDNILESMGGGVAFIDFDNDGWQDIFLTGGPDQLSRLYRNNGNGTFTDVTAKSGMTHKCWAMGAAVADYDNDGYDDIYLTCFGGNVLYRNNGDGTFTDVTAKAGVAGGGWSTSAAFADYDRDGHLDLFVARYADIDPAKLPAPGSTAYCQYRGLAVYCGPKVFSAARDILYHNNGDGTFTDVTEKMGIERTAYFGLGVLWADFNGDGWPDLYVANDSTPSALYINQAGRGFIEQGLASGVAVSDDGREQAGMGVDSADYDGDGLLDIVKTNFSDDAPNLYRNIKNAVFTDQSFPAGIGEKMRLTLGFGVKFLDIDNDGRPDIYFGNGHVYPQVDKLQSGITYRQRNFIFLNRGGGKFTEISQSAGPGAALRAVTRGVATGDFDNDGRIDLLVGHLDDTPALLANRTAKKLHWITLQLEGVKSNRNAIGALVRLDGQVQEVRANSSYLSSSDRRVHFGLGARTKIESLTIHWPSGTEQKIDVGSLAVDAFYKIREGESVQKLHMPARK